jgi:hypothetical protein
MFRRPKPLCPRLVVALLILATLCLAVPAPAVSASRTYVAEHVRCDVAIFKLVGLQASAVKAARVTRGRSHAHVKLADVRRAARRGTLRLRLSKLRWRRTRRTAPHRHGRRGTRRAHTRRRGERDRKRAGRAKETGCRKARARPAGVRRKRPKLTVITTDPPISTDPVPPPSSGGSLFSATSYLNAPLADGAPLDPTSAQAVNDLLGMVASYAEGINTSGWTTPVYTMPLGQPTVRVINDNAGHPELAEAYSAVPLPSAAQPDPQGDHHLTVWQPSSDTLWEFWGFYYDSSGMPHAKYGGRMVSVRTNPGHFVNATSPLFESKGWGATATSIPLLAGLIRYSEAQALNIPHAIAMAVPNSNCQFRNPAQRTDGGCTAAVTYLPPGARLRLPASLNVDGLACSPLCKAIARAVQRYGLVIRDRAGDISLYGENTGADWNTTIPGGKSLNGFPWDKLQMLPPTVDY